MNFHIAIETINEKILKAMLELNDNSIKIKSNNFIFTDPLLNDLFNKNLFDSSNPDCMKALKNNIISLKQESKAIVFIDDVRYYFHKRPMSDSISLTQYKKSNFTGLDKKYYQAISDNSTLIKYFEEVASQIDQKHFLKLEKDDYEEVYKFGIAWVSLISGIYYYVSEAYINLCEKYSYVLSEQEIESINTLKNDKYIPTESKSEEVELHRMFNKWFKFLTKNKHTEKNEFCFNDADNYAFISSNEKYELMTQRSQNTYYVYVREKETGRYKIWNAAMIDEDGHFEKDQTYIEVITDILNPYGYERYPCNLDHIVGYTKSPLYYLDNFDSEENIIFDTAKGYNSRSKHTGNLMSDFSLLDSVLDDYK